MPHNSFEMHRPVPPYLEPFPLRMLGLVCLWVPCLLQFAVAGFFLIVALRDITGLGPWVEVGLFGRIVLYLLPPQAFAASVGMILGAPWAYLLEVGLLLFVVVLDVVQGVGIWLEGSETWFPTYGLLAALLAELAYGRWQDVKRWRQGSISGSD